MAYGSILIYGGNKKSREEKATKLIEKISPNFIKKDHPDLLIIDKEKKQSIGINKIRKAINFLAIKPYSEINKIVVIRNADRLTSQAQNALLKTLEEPPLYAVIILIAKTEAALLPTVISRCKRIKSTQGTDDYIEGEISTKDNLSTVLKGGVGEKLDYAEKFYKKDREKIIEILEYWVIQERKQMLQSGKNTHAQNIKRILTIIDDLENTNVNTRLSLENLLFLLE